MRGLALDDVAATLTADVHEIGLLQFLDKFGKAVRAVRFFRKRRIELQHGGFQQSELRLHAAAFQHLQSALDEWHGLRQLERSGTLPSLFAAEPILTLRRTALHAIVRTGPFDRCCYYRRRADGGVGQQRFITDELVAVLLQDRAGEGLSANNEHGLAVFLELVHERDEVAIAANDGERVHMAVRERHLQSVESEIDIGAVLVAAGRRQALHHLYGVLRHSSSGAFLPSPVGVCEFGDDVAALFQSLYCHGDIEFAPQRGLYADLYIVVIDKDGNVQFFLH